MKIIDVLTAPWAIQRGKYEEIVRIYKSWSNGEKIDIKAVEAQIGYPLDNEQARYDVIDGVAVIPVFGVLAKRMNMLTQISGGSSTQLIMQDFASAINDPVVKSVLLLVDSPGGTVDGTQTLADAIFNARGTKPINALADGMAASAAYWIASAADRVYASNGTTLLGSIGVVTSHVDVSKAEEKAGIKTTEIYAGKYKRLVSEYKPLDEEGEKYLQDYVDYYYSIFIGDIARNRGTDEETTLRDMADGRDFIGQQAVDTGLADGIVSYEEMLSQMIRGQNEPDGQIRKKAAHKNQQGGGSMGSEKKNAAQTAAMLEPEVEDLAGKLIAGVLTSAQIRENYPDAAKEIYQSGVADGAKAERERIKAVEAQALPGHEKLIAGLKFDGTTTGEQAALKVLAAEKTNRENRLSALEAEAPKPAPPSTEPSASTSLNPEEADERTWNTSAELREEFGEKKERYLAYMKAEREGKVKKAEKK